MVGVIEVHEQPGLNQFGYIDWPWDPEHIVDAVGNVTVEKDKFLYLNLNGKIDDLALLGKLPADSIDGLSVSNMELGDEEFREIGRLENLRVLRFVECSISPKLKPESLAIAAKVEAINSSFKAGRRFGWLFSLGISMPKACLALLRQSMHQFYRSCSLCWPSFNDVYAN